METPKLSKVLAAIHQRLMRQGDGLLAVVEGEEECEGAVLGERHHLLAAIAYGGLQCCHPDAGSACVIIYVPTVSAESRRANTEGAGESEDFHTAMVGTSIQKLQMLQAIARTAHLSSAQQRQ